MFTGIIEATATVDALEPAADGTGARLAISTQLDLASLPLGASIAVDGVCLTVVDKTGATTGGRFAADLGPETLARTTLGKLRAGDRVHLERPLRMGDALGGHLVSGHVDGVGAVAARRPVGTALELEITAPPEVARTLVAKGSMAVDGVSLTVNAVTANGFSVTLIPHTLSATKLGDKAVGAAVNLEADLIAKQVERLVAARLDGGALPAPRAPKPPLSLETLRRHGFAR